MTPQKGCEWRVESGATLETKTSTIIDSTDMYARELTCDIHTQTAYNKETSLREVIQTFVHEIDGPKQTSLQNGWIWIENLYEQHVKIS